MEKFKRLAIGVEDAAASIGIGASLMRELVKSGEVGSIRVGGRLLVPTEVLEAYIANKMKAATANTAVQ